MPFYTIIPALKNEETCISETQVTTHPIKKQLRPENAASIFLGTVRVRIIRLQNDVTEKITTWISSLRTVITSGFAIRSHLKECSSHVGFSF
jgi:hypothetical protein